MTRIAVSGASGNLGRQITDQLLEWMVSADLTLVTRAPL